MFFLRGRGRARIGNPQTGANASGWLAAFCSQSNNDGWMANPWRAGRFASERQPYRIPASQEERHVFRCWSFPCQTKTMNRVVVTGVGCVTPLGKDVPQTWTRLLSGHSGLSLYPLRHAPLSSPVPNKPISHLLAQWTVAYVSNDWQADDVL